MRGLDNLIADIKEYSYDNAKKYVFCLRDSSMVEMAVFVHKCEMHFCVSTQVGCPVGCRHCATTYSPIPYRRNLTFEELQKMITYATIKNDFSGRKILSFSGHGEPLLNWKTVLSIKNCFLEYFDQIYVTTIGNKKLLDQILRDEQRNIVFYLSLHGSSDAERALLIPNSTRYITVANLFHFTREYSGSNGRIVLNYMMHKGNSSKESIDRLLVNLRNCNQNVSLRLTDFNRIGYQTDIQPLTDMEIEHVLLYIKQKKDSQDKWTYRHSCLEGKNIQIACGQLRATVMEKVDD